MFSRWTVAIYSESFL